MPKNLHFDIRKQHLNELLRSTRGYTLEELIEKVGEKISDYRKGSKGVSKKTIQNDIRFMKEEAAKKNAKIVCINSRYRYEPPGFNIFDIQVDPYSVEKIKLAIALLQQIKGLDLHEELKEVYDKLNMRVSEASEPIPGYIQFDLKPEYIGADYIGTLLEAIATERVISFDYHPFTAPEKYRVIVHPYLLKEYNNRWFLIGWIDEKKLVQVFALDRIKGEVKPEGWLEFYNHYKFNPDTYYNDVIGVSIPVDGKIEKIHLKFRKERVPYVQTNQLHHSFKKISEDETGTIFQYSLIPNNELKAQILYFGSDVEVLEPKQLRAEIAAIIAESSKKYI